MAPVLTAPASADVNSASLRPGFLRRLAFAALALTGLGAGLGAPLPAFAYQQPAQSAFLAPRSATAAPTGFSGLCSRYHWLCSTTGSTAPLGDGWIQLARQVNAQVNRSVPQIEDSAQYGVSDVWALPTARGGDCEDIAMLKKKLLVQQGVPGQDLRIATVLDRNRQNHAVLVMRTTRGDLVLDNLNRQILPWRATGYTFLTIQSERAPSRWEAVMRGGLMDQRVAGN